MALVNMKLSAEEAAEMSGAMPMEATAPESPYGLRLSLSEEDLAKLGLDLPRAGATVNIVAVGLVCNVNERVEEGEGEVEACVCIQITDMSATVKSSLAARMYPKLAEQE
jgi:hypothetical protein